MGWLTILVYQSHTVQQGKVIFSADFNGKVKLLLQKTFTLHNLQQNYCKERVITAQPSLKNT
jgi:hypothetical protein